jgi:predicted phosphodiesterase
MRIAALFDIHGNSPALEAVLADIRRLGVDRIVVGGDVVPGPMPAPALELLLHSGLPTLFIHGNGERDVVSASKGEALTRVPPAFRDAITWSAEQLNRQQLGIIESWPRTAEIQSGGRRFLFCHATPRDDNEIITRDTADGVLTALFGVGGLTAVCGHTHMQFDRRIDALRIVNAGSVGMPFGAPGAYWALLDDDTVEMRHLPYDVDAAAERIRATSFPGASDFAARCVHPLDANAMLQAFNNAAR